MEVVVVKTLKFPEIKQRLEEKLSENYFISNFCRLKHPQNENYNLIKEIVSH